MKTDSRWPLWVQMLLSGKISIWEVISARFEKLMVNCFGKICQHQCGYFQDVDDDELAKIDAGTSKYLTYDHFLREVENTADKKCVVCGKFFR